MNRGISHPEDRSCSVVWWHSKGFFCITCQMTQILDIVDLNNGLEAMGILQSY